mmetsp:Transcript_22201/g.44627  ORF Transcript_22201/g.44627 Transcript_22201/m.44627 type:complete len:470 (-) Transcript_22201:257-1666(-)
MASSPSRATRNVSIVDAGGLNGPSDQSPPSMLDGGDPVRSGPTAIPADEGDVSRQAKASAAGVAVLESIPAAANSSAVDESSGANAGDEDGVTENDGDEHATDNNDEEASDNESEYSYTYEDEDETHYSGFLIPTDNPFSSSATSGGEGAAAAAASAAVEETTTTHVNSISRTNSRMSSDGRSTPSSSNNNSNSATAVPETNPQENQLKQKWKEPTRAAVDMSLRAEKEKTGGKRRLASDLYKIMMADTTEAGFSLEPSDEDSMEKWRIKLFDFDCDSNLAKDLLVCGLNHVELEMSFPDQYPFEPPFVRVVQPRFKRQTGFVMSGALCMELLTNDGWNPVNDIESVIVSIRSIMVIGDGRVQAACDMSKEDYKKTLADALSKSKAKKEGKSEEDDDDAEDGDRPGEVKRKRAPSEEDDDDADTKGVSKNRKSSGGAYSASEAKSAYQHLSKYHEKEGWDKSGWWARQG